MAWKVDEAADYAGAWHIFKCHPDYTRQDKLELAWERLYSA
jgi:hypothetical protein